MNESAVDLDTYTPWLPVNRNKNKVNVEVEQDVVDGYTEPNLELFLDLMEIRRYEHFIHFYILLRVRYSRFLVCSYDVFVNGDVYYPYHDQNVFSYMR